MSDYDFEYGENGLKPCDHVTIEWIVAEARREGISLAEYQRRTGATLQALWDRNRDNFDLGVEQDNLLHMLNLLEVHRIKCGGILPETAAGES